MCTDIVDDNLFIIINNKLSDIVKTIHKKKISFSFALYIFFINQLKKLVFRKFPSNYFPSLKNSLWKKIEFLTNSIIKIRKTKFAK